MKYFVFSDIHGDYRALIDALEHAGYDKSNSNHRIICCGDCFGRADTGKGSLGVYEYLVKENHTNKPIVIKGNHELILRDIIQRRRLTYTDIYNGEDKTMRSLTKEYYSYFYDDTLYDEPIIKEVKEWIESLPFYYETKTAVFTHGWLPSVSSNWRNSPVDYWEEATWSYTPDMLEYGNVEKYIGDKHLYVGHWHAFDIKHRETGIEDYDCLVYTSKRGNVTFLDSCTAYNHVMGIAIVEEED